MFVRMAIIAYVVFCSGDCAKADDSPSLMSSFSANFQLRHYEGLPPVIVRTGKGSIAWSKSKWTIRGSFVWNEKSKERKEVIERDDFFLLESSDVRTIAYSEDGKSIFHQSFWKLNPEKLHWHSLPLVVDYLDGFPLLLQTNMWQDPDCQKANRPSAAFSGKINHRDVAMSFDAGSKLSSLRVFQDWHETSDPNEKTRDTTTLRFSDYQNIDAGALPRSFESESVSEQKDGMKFRYRVEIRLDSISSNLKDEDFFPRIVPTDGSHIQSMKESSLDFRVQGDKNILHVDSFAERNLKRLKFVSAPRWKYSLIGIVALVAIFGTWRWRRNRRTRSGRRV